MHVTKPNYTRQTHLQAVSQTLPLCIERKLSFIVFGKTSGCTCCCIKKDKRRQISRTKALVLEAAEFY